MSDYLGHLLERSFAPAPEVRPQIPSLFESKAAVEQTERFLEAVETTQRGAGEKPANRLPLNSENKPSSSDPRENSGDQLLEKIAPKENVPAPTKTSSQERSHPNESIQHPETLTTDYSSVKPVRQRKPPIAPTPSRPVQPPVEQEISMVSVETRSAAKVANQVVVDFPAAAQAAGLVPGSQQRTTGPIDDSERRSGDRRPPTTTPSLQPRTTQVAPSAITSVHPAKPAAAQPLSAISTPAKNKSHEQSSILADAPLPPSIQVTIGRVEIRAHTPPPVIARSAPRKEPAMSLENYLRRRAGGSS